MNRFLGSFLTILRGKGQISQTREILTPGNREMIGDLFSVFSLRKLVNRSSVSQFPKLVNREPVNRSPRTESRKLITDLVCPHCASGKFVRRGWRRKKREQVQLLLCRSCGKTFTPHAVKGKHYPLATIFNAISLYNLGYSLEECCRRVSGKKEASVSGSFSSVGSVDPAPDTREGSVSQVTNVVNMAEGGGHDPQPLRADACIKRSPLLADSPSSHKTSISINPSTLSGWISQFKDNLPYARMRDFAASKYKPADMVVTATLAHQQLFRYRFHRAKCQLIMQEHFHHSFFKPLAEFLELVPAECPHQYFRELKTQNVSPATDFCAKRTAAIGMRFYRGHRSTGLLNT
jgi:transposase-like protein